MKRRSVFELADELLENSFVGGFGDAYNSIRIVDVDDPDEETPEQLVIVAKGEHAAILSRAYSEAMERTPEIARRIRR